MMNANPSPEDGRCAHPSCACAAEQADGYCSPYCAGADHSDPETGACACGHQACVEDQQGEPPHSRSETKTSIGSR